MGAIHERLQGIQDALRLEQDTKIEHERKKNEVRANLDLYHEAQLEQHEKFKTLQETGVFDMVEDATEGLKIRSRQSVHKLKELESMRVLPQLEDVKKAVKSMSGNKNIMNSLGGNLHWVAEIPDVTVKDDLTFDTNLTIIIKRIERVKERHSFTHNEERERVTISFDGTNIKINGAENTFEGVIPKDPMERQNVLENAFVEAFYAPQKFEEKRHQNFSNWDNRIGSTG